MSDEQLASVTGHMPGLDGLRGLLVPIVLSYHLGVAGFGGFLALEGFFVLSGFLITLLLLDNPPHGPRDLGRWWSRRWRRLLPAATVVVATTVLLFHRTPGIAGDAVSTLTWWRNWEMAFGSTSYWSTAPSPLKHAWSLSVEEQFYLLFPLLLLGVIAVGRRIRWSPRAAVGIACVTLATVGYGWQAWLASRSDDLNRVYLGTDTRGGSILLGCAVGALVHGSRSRRSPASKQLNALIVTGLVTIAVLGLVLEIESLRTYQGGLLADGARLGCTDGRCVASRSFRDCAVLPAAAVDGRPVLWHLPVVLARAGVRPDPMAVAGARRPRSDHHPGGVPPGRPLAPSGRTTLRDRAGWARPAPRSQGRLGGRPCRGSGPRRGGRAGAPRTGHGRGDERAVDDRRCDVVGEGAAVARAQQDDTDALGAGHHRERLVRSSRRRRQVSPAACPGAADQRRPAAAHRPGRWRLTGLDDGVRRRAGRTAGPHRRRGERRSPGVRGAGPHRGMDGGQPGARRSRRRFVLSRNRFRGGRRGHRAVSTPRLARHHLRRLRAVPLVPDPRRADAPPHHPEIRQAIKDALDLRIRRANAHGTRVALLEFACPGRVQGEVGWDEFTRESIEWHNSNLKEVAAAHPGTITIPPDGGCASTGMLPVDPHQRRPTRGEPRIACT